MIFSPLTFKHGPDMPNRFMLAPLTNSQSHDDGVLSDEEYHWLMMRVEGGYGLTMTCAAHVIDWGQGFPGQLGCFDDRQDEGLSKLARGINKAGAVSSVQLYHGGIRCPETLTGRKPQSASSDQETEAQAMSEEVILEVIEAFIKGAERAERCGFHGIELHGAHGYLICQFLSPETNRRTDAWGGSLANRSQFLMQTIDGIRQRTGPDFQVGVRLSPERFGVPLGEAIELYETLIQQDQLDYIDMSLWDVFKTPADNSDKRSLLEIFGALPRQQTRLGVAGKISTVADVNRCLELGADFAIQGRSAILHHDFPKRAESNPEFAPSSLPVTAAHLATEGLSETFIQYMRNWPGFVED
jgi:2,4-dienoyl-CoA reductase-like NADH-dependent reductase (Old Yellow Enzyme family)